MKKLILIGALILSPFTSASANSVLTSCIATSARDSYAVLESMAVECCGRASKVTGLAAGRALPATQAVRMKMSGLGMDFSHLDSKIDVATQDYVRVLDALTKSVIVTCIRPKP